MGERQCVTCHRCQQEHVGHGFLEERAHTPLHLKCNLLQSQTSPLLGYTDLGVYRLRFRARMVLWCLLVLQTPLQRAAGLGKNERETEKASSWVVPICIKATARLGMDSCSLRTASAVPSTGCSGAAPSSVMDAIVPPPGLGGGGEGRGGLWVSPELPAGGGCCCPRLPLPPRAPLRTGPGRGSAESGPVHPGGSGPIPPPAAEGGGKGAGDGGDAWERGAHHWAGGRGGKECKGVSPLLPICAPIACVQEGTSLLRGTRFGTAACPISCRSLSMPLLADKPPRAMAAVALCL